MLLGVQVSSHLLLTLRLSEGAEARVFPIPSVDKGGRSGSITLRNVNNAHAVRLCEIVPLQGTFPPQKTSKEEQADNKRRQWLSLFLRETLGMYC